jgi:hypothetical protein
MYFYQNAIPSEWFQKYAVKTTEFTKGVYSNCSECLSPPLQRPHRQASDVIYLQSKNTDVAGTDYSQIGDKQVKVVAGLNLI